MVPTQSHAVQSETGTSLQNKLNPDSVLPVLTGHKFLKTIKKIIADRVDL